MRTLAAAAVLIAAIQAADPAACTPYAHACGITFHGLYVREGVVWDVVTPSCDEPPEAHYIQAWIEYKPFDEWGSYDRHAGTHDIPDKTGFQIKVRSRCVSGWYRTRVHVEGRGPATADNPKGIPFDYEDTGLENHFSAAECATR